MAENKETLTIELEINENEEDYVVTYEVNYSTDEELHFLHFEDGGETKILNFSGATVLDDLRLNHKELSDSICQDTLMESLYNYHNYLEFPVPSDIVENLQEDEFQCESLHYFRGEYSGGYYYVISKPSEPFLMLAATDNLLSKTEYTAKLHGIHLDDVPLSIDDFYEFVVEGNRDF